MTANARLPRARQALLIVGISTALANACVVTPPSTEDFVSTHLAGTARIFGTGDLRSLNIVILGDGFTDQPIAPGTSDPTTHLDVYRQSAQDVAANLMAARPFAAMSDAVNVYRVDVRSDEAGIDVPESCGTGADYYSYPNPGVGSEPYARSQAYRNSALETTWCDSATGTYRFIESHNEALVWAFARKAGVFPDLVVVLVNDWFWGAVAWPSDPLRARSGGIVYAAIGRNLIHELSPNPPYSLIGNMGASEFPIIVTHEIGHLGPFHLLDEYGYDPGPITGAAAAEILASANLTSTPNPLKWQTFVPPGSPIPTDCSNPSVPKPDAGAAPRGDGYTSGVYHARCHCRMNQYHTESFCIVCRRQILSALAPHLPSARTGTVRVIVDSLQIRQGAGGSYRINYRVNIQGTQTSGMWPQAGPILLPSGQVEEPGSVLFEGIPLDPVLRIDFRIIPVAGATSTAARGSIVFRVPRAGEARIVVDDQHSFRMTLGIVATR